MTAMLIYTRHLLGRHAQTAFWWAVAVSVYFGIMIAAYPTFVESGTLDLDRLPKFMIEAFDIPDMTILANFLDREVFGNLPLVLPFFPLMAFANALAGAEDRGALDILLGNPISRRAVVFSTWLSILIHVVAISLIVGVSTWLVAQANDLDLSLHDILRGCLNLVPIVMVFGGLALVLSSVMRRAGAVIGITFIVLFLQYLFEVLSGFSPKFETLGTVSVFHYYGHAITEGISWPHWFGLSSLAVAFLLLAIWLFDRRDIYT